MLVEDSPEDEELTLRALARSGLPIGTTVARDGEEALDYLFGEGEHEGRDLSVMPNLILLDLKLPKVSGLNILRRLRAAEHTRLIPVVVLTSSDEDGDILRAYELGANSYLRKPVQSERFVEAVRQLGLYWLDLNEALPQRS